jgi:hypothetical protein
VGGQHHALAALTPGKTRYSLSRRLGGPQGRSGRVRKTSSPPGFDPRTVQSVASRYTDRATRPTYNNNRLPKFYSSKPVRREALKMIVHKIVEFLYLSIHPSVCLYSETWVFFVGMFGYEYQLLVMCLTKKQNQTMTAKNDIWMYKFFSWYCNHQKVTESSCSVKAAAFLTELPNGKFRFSHIFL